MVMAPTELSATAPLKVAARDGGFRAATMPGFLPSMIPALRLDYGEVNRRVDLLKQLLDAAERADCASRPDGSEPRPGPGPAPPHRPRLRRPVPDGNGVAGNLPSGEAYIVPYEGERAGDPSGSAGSPAGADRRRGGGLPHRRQPGGRRSWATGPAGRAEAAHIAAEPAYANLAELGLGVLGDFGLEPCGEILLDEKLGLHIAFGRSDHFGGTVGPGDFSGPDAVIHLDRVYIRATQPAVTVQERAPGGPGLDRDHHRRRRLPAACDGEPVGGPPGEAATKGSRGLSVNDSRPKSFGHWWPRP